MGIPGNGNACCFMRQRCLKGFILYEALDISETKVCLHGFGSPLLCYVYFIYGMCPRLRHYRRIGLIIGPLLEERKFKQPTNRLSLPVDMSLTKKIGKTHKLLFPRVRPPMQDKCKSGVVSASAIGIAALSLLCEEATTTIFIWRAMRQMAVLNFFAMPLCITNLRPGSRIASES